MRSLVAAALVAGFASLATLAAEDDKATLNFVNADIASVVKAVGAQTGKNFILDPRVQGTVNVVSEKPVPKELLYPMLLSVLRTQGFAALETGDGFVRIVPEADAKAQSSPVGDAAAKVRGERMVTRVFILQNESAPQLVAAIRPLVPPNNFLAAYPGNNAIIITDYAENVRRVEAVIKAIDQPGTVDAQLVVLKNASAIDVAQILRSVVPETAVNASTPGTSPRATIGVDARTNSLIVRADSAALAERIRTLAAGLDTPGAGAGNIHVVHLRNAEAEKIADVLRGLMTGERTARAATTTSAQSTPATTAGSSGTPTGASATSAPGAAAAAPASTIQAYAPTNSLIITAPEPTYRSLRAVIDKLDVRRAQVLVEALIVEVQTGASAEVGVQFQGLSGINRDGRQVVGYGQ